MNITRLLTRMREEMLKAGITPDKITVHQNPKNRPNVMLLTWVVQKDLVFFSVTKEVDMCEVSNSHLAWCHIHALIEEAIVEFKEHFNELERVNKS